MSTENTKTDFTPNPAGSVKTIHGELDSFKMDAPHKVGKTGRGPKLTIETTTGETKVEKLPGNKFLGDALKVPGNKSLKADLDILEDSFEEGMDVTFTYVMESTPKGSFWGLTGVKAGHIGVSGVVKADADGNLPSKGSNTGSQANQAPAKAYDASGAIAGQLFNLAASVAEKTLSKADFNLVNIEKIALDSLDQFLEIKNNLEGKVRAANKSKPAPEKKEIKETGKANPDPDLEDGDEEEFE